MKINKDFDWNKVAWKFAKAAFYVVLAGLAANYGDNQYYLAIAPFLFALENAIKHGFSK